MSAPIKIGQKWTRQEPVEPDDGWNELVITAWQDVREGMGEHVCRQANGLDTVGATSAQLEEVYVLADSGTASVLPSIAAGTALEEWIA